MLYAALQHKIAATRKESVMDLPSGNVPSRVEIRSAGVTGVIIRQPCFLHQPWWLRISVVAPAFAPVRKVQVPKVKKPEGRLVSMVNLSPPVKVSMA